VLRNLRKLEQIVFYLALLFLPTQLGRHFWPKFSYVSGIRVDYLSPTLYFTDVLIFILFLLFTISLFFKKNLIFKKAKRNIWIFVWGFSLIAGVLISKSPSLGWYYLLKLIEFSFFGAYLAQWLRNKKNLGRLIVVLGIGVFYESIIAISQFFTKGSIGGPLYFLGERYFNGQTPGIANASLAGQLILRPYATFPHPNVLAGFLLTSLTFILFFLPRIKEKKLRLLYFLIIGVGSLALVLTMSRVSILLYVFLLLYLIFKKNQRILLIALIVVFSLVVLSPEKYRFLGFNFSENSFVERQQLILSSIFMFKDNPFLGVGINNFLVNLPEYFKMNLQFFLQPVHNIYLLILSQTGVIGIIFFFWFIKKTINKIRKKENKLNLLKLTLLLTVLILGFFDHYFLTLQQGQMLLALVLGFLWTDTKALS
jgi:O-antigen ligase